MQHIQRVIKLMLGCQNHAENTYGKAFHTEKIHHLHHFNTPHTLQDSPVESWKLKRPSGGNACVCVCALHASLSCVSVCAYVNIFVIRSLSCRSDECTRTQCSSSFLPSCSSPVVLFSEPLAEQLEDISLISCELLLGASRLGLSPVAILCLFHNSSRYAGASGDQP